MLFDSSLPRIRPAFEDALRIDVDAHAARRELLYGCDYDSAVTAAQVVNAVTGADLGKLQHLDHHTLRRRLIGHVRSPRTWCGYD